MKVNRLKNTIKVIAINGIIVLAIVLCMEGLVRLFADRVSTQGTDGHLIESKVYYDSHSLKAGASGKVFGETANVDEYRFRKGGKPVSKKKKSFLFLGDSVTMGVGVEDDSTFAARVSSSINENLLNASLIGYSTHDYLNVVRTLVEDDQNNWQIKNILVCYTLNDLYSKAPEGSPDKKSNTIVKNILTILKNNSRLYI